MLVEENDLLDREMLLINCICTTCLLYTWPSWGLHPLIKGIRGRRPRRKFLRCMLANNFVDPWYWVTHSIFPWYFPYKRKNCNTAMYGIVLYCSIVNNLCDCMRETVRA